MCKGHRVNLIMQSSKLGSETDCNRRMQKMPSNAGGICNRAPTGECWNGLWIPFGRRLQAQSGTSTQVPCSISVDWLCMADTAQLPADTFGRMLRVPAGHSNIVQHELKEIVGDVT